MLYDFSATVPFIVVVAMLALVGSIASVAVLAQSTVWHHRNRVARHQSIPTYYRGIVAAR